jgi:hypothetical protein
MENAGRQQAGGAGLGAFDEMADGADAARGDSPANAPRVTARSRSRSKPGPVPSRSMLVSRISPAPRDLHLPHPIENIEAGGRAAAMGEHLPAAVARWLRHRPRQRRTGCRISRPLAHQPGRATAAELMLHLSAPASSRRRMSSVLRMPPPTVSGRNTRAAVRDTTSRIVSRFSWLAVMSRNVSSSAPAASYTAACSTGSPASRRSTKFTPLTTRPSLTSRAGDDDGAFNRAPVPPEGPSSVRQSPWLSDAFSYGKRALEHAALGHGSARRARVHTAAAAFVAAATASPRVCFSASSTLRATSGCRARLPGAARRGRG